jgi:hypothetical protein
MASFRDLNAQKARHVHEYISFDKDDPQYEHSDKVEAVIRFLGYDDLEIDKKKVSNRDIYKHCGVSETCGKT